MRRKISLMNSGVKYQSRQEDGWNLLVLAERWSQELWGEVSRQLINQCPTDHPQTKRFRYPAGPNGVEFFLKIYHPSRLSGALKDLFRDSKAFRALKQGEALSEQGFQVPLTLAAGEERSFRLLKRAFLLTLEVKGSSLLLFLRDQCSSPPDHDALMKKRAYLNQLAQEVRRLHRLGFVHGDLVPTNIIIHCENGGITFFYLDNDRTRRYSIWLPHDLWKRNLVQLNRFVLPGISLQDRMRFLRYYLANSSWGRGERRLIRYLEEETRKRRRECDRISANVSFRELMRWNGPFARNIQ